MGNPLSGGSEPYPVPGSERRIPTPGRRITDQRSHLREGRTGCRIIELPEIPDPRGNLTFIEGGGTCRSTSPASTTSTTCPAVRRAAGTRTKLHQLIIAMSGSFDVVLDDGARRSASTSTAPTRPVRAPDDLARARQLLVRLGVPGARVAALRRGRLLPRLRRVPAAALREQRPGRVRTAVPFLDLAPAMHPSCARELDARRARARIPAGTSSAPEVEAFEAEFAAYCGAAHCVGVGNGLDALRSRCARSASAPGDEVIVPAQHLHRHLARRQRVGARRCRSSPRRPCTRPGRAEAAITARTRAIVPVHLYGQPGRPGRAASASPPARPGGPRGRRAGARRALPGQPRRRARRRRGLELLPRQEPRRVGDGGAVTTDDAALADRAARAAQLRLARSTCTTRSGFNSRLDELQAAVLRVKLRHLDDWNARRAAVAARTWGAGRPAVALPDVARRADPAWHLFVVRTPSAATRSRRTSRGGRRDARSTTRSRRTGRALRRRRGRRAPLPSRTGSPRGAVAADRPAPGDADVGRVIEAVASF